MTFVCISVVVLSRLNEFWVRERVAEEQGIESVGGKQLVERRDCGVWAG